MSVTLDPLDWLPSTVRALNDYISSRFAAAVSGEGLQAYEIIMSYPTADSLPKGAEFIKTIIHFDIDDITTRKLGFGTDIISAAVVNGIGVPGQAGSSPGTVTEHQAMRHEISFDVGIWASDESGGVTARLRAYQYLNKFLSGEIARQKCLAATDGVEIMSYNSGRFVTQTINDVRVFCVVGAELEVRVFSRDDADPEILVDQEPTQEPELVIQGDDGSLADLTD